MNTKQILWENVKALMVKTYGEENLYKTVKDSKSKGIPISLGSLQRIKAQDTAVGIDVLDKIASHFELQAWQLLIQNLDPANPPVFILDKKQQEFFTRMKSAYKDLVQQ
jgi:hypothetical protein